MTSRNALILSIAAVAVLAVALLLSGRDTTSDHAPADALYPDLKKELTAVSAVRVFGASDTRIVEIVRKDGQWVVADRAGYPANAAKVNTLLLALADAKPLEEKTSDPKNYATLGVEDLKTEAATGTRIELEGPKNPVNLIVGKSAGARGAYVRRAGEAASWLIDQTVDVSSAPGEWLQTTIIDVSADRVQSATVKIEGAKPYTAEKSSRADADFKTDAIPKGKEADASSINLFASALSNLNLSDVRPAKDFESDKPVAHATIRTFDGLIVELDGWVKDGKHFVALRTSHDDAVAKRFHVETQAPEKAADAKTEADAAAKPAAESVTEAAAKTNAQVQGWVYEIPDYKYGAIFKPASDLVAK
jgi:hypothetical protein